MRENRSPALEQDMRYGSHKLLPLALENLAIMISESKGYLIAITLVVYIFFSI